MTDTQKICFILIPGLAPDNYPVLGLEKILKDRGFEVIATNFFGNVGVDDFSQLTISQCIDNISSLINKAAVEHEAVFGIGISLGGALLLEHAKNGNKLDGIVSIGTPFRLKNKKMIFWGQKIIPLIYPFWRRLQKYKRLRLSPIGAAVMSLEYMEGEFLKKLENITVPVLFLHSKKDRITDHNALREFFSVLSSPKKDMYFFDNGGHVINYSPLIIEKALTFFDLENQKEN
jgi:esterase/lipase